MNVGSRAGAEDVRSHRWLRTTSKPVVHVKKEKRRGLDARLVLESKARPQGLQVFGFLKPAFEGKEYLFAFKKLPNSNFNLIF